MELAPVGQLGQRVKVRLLGKLLVQPAVLDGQSGRSLRPQDQHRRGFERLGGLLLPDQNALAKLFQGEKRVWVIGYGNAMESLQQEQKAMPHLVARVGRWELFSNR